MPATHVVPVTTDFRVYTVSKNGEERHAQILQRRTGEVYVHYMNTDKRLDEWIPEDDCIPVIIAQEFGELETRRKRKRGRPKQVQPTSPGRSSSLRVSEDIVEAFAGNDGITQGEVIMTEEDFDIQHHKQITAQRNFDMVHFGDWQIKTWYFSPYPLIETEQDEVPGNQIPSSSAGPQSSKIPGVNRTTSRSHGRTSDILAGGLGRHSGAEKTTLWVCEMCFKYMADGLSWELHKKVCTRLHPPGRKVYQRGAHSIYEVDGAKEKLYCQNLSLFGKLFIDVKTLFFDCDNFLFYILTDATSTSDHMLGFFSKEKVSYDDYNLACIMTLPPYQRKGYGMLMIEFSYELSRRAGKAGTPERPLSDLGLRSYLAYWVSTLIRFFRRVLSVLPPEVTKVKTVGNFPDLTRSPIGEIDNGAPRRKKRAKGWDGEAIDLPPSMTPLTTMDDPMFTSQRSFMTVHRDDGCAETHVSVRCTLADIARATNMRPEDAAFALNECGLLARKFSETPEQDVVVLTRKTVEKIAKERNVKRMCIELDCVTL